MNIITTIPRSHHPNWEHCKRMLNLTDGEYHSGLGPWLYLINTTNLPKKSGVGDICFVVFEGIIRGYMDIIDTGVSESYREVHGLGKKRNTNSIVLINFVETDRGPMKGFQGWRYTELIK